MYKRKEDPSYLDNRMVVTRRGDAVSVKVNRANLAVFKKKCVILRCQGMEYLSC